MEQIDNVQNQTKGVQQTPEKKRSGKSILILGSTIVLVLIAAFIFLITSRKSSTVSTVPLETYTFYSAVYQNKPVLFYKYPGMLLGLKPIGSYEGEYIPYTMAMSPMMMNLMMNVEYVDFRKLQNQKKLFTFDRYATIENIKLSPDSSYLMMSIVGGTSDNTNYIYQVNLRTSEGKKVYEHTLRTGNQPLNEGFIYVIDFVPNKYVIFGIIQGNPPPNTMPKGTVVVNLQTMSVKSFDAIGDTHINLSSKTISYKKLAAQQIPCSNDNPVCFKGDKYTIMYIPNGQAYTSQLP